MNNKFFVMVLTLFFLIMPFYSHAFEAKPFLNDLLAISSGTNNISGVKSVSDKIEMHLKALGFMTEYRNHATEPDLVPLLVGTFVGEKPNFITFVMHSDTVFESNTVAVKEEDGKLYGPGVIDDKGGIVVAFKGIADFLASSPKPAYSLRVVVSLAEETGSAGFLKHFSEYSKDSFMVLGFEPALEDGSIIDSRRGDRWYKITVKGKEAHAGRAHKQGINACHELAIKIDQLQNLTNY